MAVVIIAANAVVIAGAADSGGVRPGDGVGAGGKHRAHGRVGEAVILRAEHLIAGGTLHGAPGQHRLAAVIQLQRRDLRRVHGGRRLAVPAGRLTEVAVRAAADGAYLIVIPGVGLGGGILVERDVRRHDKGIGGSGRGAAVGGGLCAPRFFSSTTVQEPSHGWLVTAPTSSPENSFYVPGDSVTPVSICMGPTMDVQLLTELYINVIAAARLLDCDADYVAKLEADLKRFPPMQISKEGYLQEWLEDYKEVDVHHRHVSHLYGLHPGNLISPESTPELAEACRMTLNRRGDEGTGWSRAWKINFWARLGDGNRAWKLFKSLLHPAVDAATGGHGSGTFPNLFCSHPPFQIDGNYGGAAGVGEMLLQSHEGFIHLLPALPDSWTTGNFRGMRVRGGASIDLDWKDGRATRAVVTALVPGKFTVKMPASTVRAEVKVGGHTHTYKKPAFSLDLNKGEAATIHFL